MLVQRRSPDADAPAGAPVPTIRVKVKFNGVYHEIYIKSQASFGELKKMLSARTGLHPEDQKLVYKDKERDSKAFLDMAGVKDCSKMVLLEEPAAQAKRLLEQRRADKAERATKSISRISLDVDKLATKARKGCEDRGASMTPFHRWKAEGAVGGHGRKEESRMESSATCGTNVWDIRLMWNERNDNLFFTRLR
ncbi:BAG family molecular chaperone regulator 1 [Zea mays]|uniref:BAG family molecular chaperone regulator 1 n=1 Tax=Zea mays TaxID=4577 RepID=A0A3L6EB00_MAIZE|nr:BAG family molecular chaperone regulator 1 [Zea mays]